MKIKSTFFLITCLLFGNIVMAQHQEDGHTPVKPRWYSEKGFWVVETNLKTPQNSIVNFYTADRKLIYTEKVTGVVLNTNKRKTLMKLKRVLEKVAYDWETNGVVQGTGELTAILTNKK